MSKFCEKELIEAGTILCDQNKALKERFRALFSLKEAVKLDPNNSDLIVNLMFKALDKSEPSALLKHEVAYCLGQTECPKAISLLETVLSDTSREAIVRHEAGEALGAIGKLDSLPLLSKIAEKDPSPEVQDTCELAVARLQWLHGEQFQAENHLLSSNPYNSVDPAPPALERDTDKLLKNLLDENQSLFERYRAMFALRNKGDNESIAALAKGFTSSNTLFRHEIAYVLGQIQSEISTEPLMERLRDNKENDMVRHECAEALGSIATDNINEELKKYLDPSIPPVIRESCVVALDFSDYNQSDQFQYADALTAA